MGIVPTERLKLRQHAVVETLRVDLRTRKKKLEPAGTCEEEEVRCEVFYRQEEPCFQENYVRIRRRQSSCISLTERLKSRQHIVAVAGTKESVSSSLFTEVIFLELEEEATVTHPAV